MGWPAASALTSAVCIGLPPIPQSPLATSSTTTQVTGRMFSPSTSTMASVTFRTMSCFWVVENTPSMTFTLTNGISDSSLICCPIGSPSRVKGSQPPEGDAFLGVIAAVTEFSEQRVAQGFPALLFADDGGRQGA